MNRIITLTRKWYYPNTTIGQWTFPNENPFCYTLEDTVRAWGIKVPKFTAIPANYNQELYKMDITFSSRFQKRLPIIYTDIIAGDHVLNFGGIRFMGVRCHGGNDSADTDGCILTAFNRLEDKIQDDASEKVVEKLDLLLKFGEVYLQIRNM